jgi:hypothetical protein
VNWFRDLLVRLDAWRLGVTLPPRGSGDDILAAVEEARRRFPRDRFFAEVDAEVEIWRRRHQGRRPFDA